MSGVLLVVAAFVFSTVFYLWLLSTTPSDAQTGGGTTGTTAGCPNPVTVEEFSGTEDRRTPEFEITGTAFRLTWDIVDIIDPNGSPSLEADVLDGSGRPIGEGFLAFEGDGSENILEGPGTFSLEIRASDVRYEIVVEDCTGTSQDGDTTMGPPTLQPSPTLGPRRKRDVIRETIPKKPLPPTGGLSVYVMVTDSILAGAGLLGLGTVIRRGPRR